MARASSQQLALGRRSRGFLTSLTAVNADVLARFEARYRTRGTTISLDPLSEITTPHIASPDVHVEVEGRRIVMCFHGLGVSHQVSRVATSQNGIDFTVRLEVIGPSDMCICSRTARPSRSPCPAC